MLVGTFETDIILVVRVPVLSLQITVVQPKVSTDGNDLTIAFNRAIRLVPRARHLLTPREIKMCEVKSKLILKQGFETISIS